MGPSFFVYVEEEVIVDGNVEHRINIIGRGLTRREAKSLIQYARKTYKKAEMCNMENIGQFDGSKKL